MNTKLNTEVCLWLAPLDMNHKRCNKKVYFKCIVKGFNEDYADNPELVLEETGLIRSIMDYACIYTNEDFGVVSVKSTLKEPTINFCESPEETENKKKEAKSKKQQIVKANKIQSKISGILSGKTDLSVTKKDLEINKDFTINVSLPEIGVKDKINFPKIFDFIENNVIGKINKGDTVSFTDKQGFELFRIMGGSFLSIGFSDIKVYDKSRNLDNVNMYNETEGLKAGAYIRDDGDIDVGDMDRTFMLTIKTKNLIVSSLRNNKSTYELPDQILIDK